METRIARRAAAWLMATMLALAGSAFAADVEPDPVTTVASARVANRVMVGDIAINHIVDGRVHFLDADTGRYLGLIGTGFAGQFTVSPKRDEIYIATSYLSRGTRGQRVDVLEVWGADSLAFRHEIGISSKRTQALNYRGYVRTSADGRFVYIQNATPATSVSVVDLRERRQVSVIETPGCWAIYPAATHPRRFSALCGDGSVQTITLDDQGRQVSRKDSPKLFDPDADALFVQAEQRGDQYRFVSFLGNTLLLDLGGEQARELERWSLVADATAAENWRPGGYQPIAVDAAGKRLFVGMHQKGAEGTHKLPAQRIWVFDLASRKRIADIEGRNAIAITTPRSGAEMLYLIDGLTNGVVVLGGADWHELRRVEPVGDASLLLESD